MRLLLLVATSLQVVAVAYGVLLLRKHPKAATAWLYLLGVMLSMLVWRIVVSTGITPGIAFNMPIAITGSVCAVLAMYFFGREVERRERAEAERDQLLTSERLARSDAERANRIKDEFLATLSHELRSPLAAILGWCEILRKPHTPDEGERAIHTIERNARMQSRLVDDLLDATRMQAGSLYLELAPVPLDGPVTAAIEGVKPAAEAKQVQIRYTAAEPAPVVIGDANRLQQIASNLLVNAVKFTPSGKSIDVVLTSTGDRAELTVTDDGIGIEPTFMPHMFQRFRQADTGNTRHHGGLGLGLSIVSSLVQLHRGDVSASSNGPGLGATFRVRLPLATPDTLAPFGPLGAAFGRAESRALIEGVRVLVVDDEPDVRGAVTALLEQSGATVRALESGAAIESAIAAFRPDVFVFDIGMPGEDGYTLLRRVRRFSSAQGGNIPAISLTAHAREEDRKRAIECGFQGHLAKPVHFPLLISTIRSLVDQRESASIPHERSAATETAGG